MLKELRIKLFGRSKKEIYDDMQVTLDEISEDLADIKNDLDDLHETVKEGLRLTLIVQEQCQQIISKMEKNNTRKDNRTLEEIVDNIEKLVGKDNAKE
ncbi:hypothetical protein SDC9_48727 [bioreactor metagenome]|uniref:Uncharacterized protein n=1 Tax=bioreactor metagenome TaxID=1076179 RepID=A0A644WG50_9ZZZZ